MKTRKLMKAYFTFAAVASIALAVCRTVLMFRFYDPYNNEYAVESYTLMKILGYCMLGVIVLCLTSLLFVRKKRFLPFTSSANQVSVFSSSFSGFLFMAVAILSVIYFPNEIFTKNGTVFFRIMNVLAFFALFPAGIYFIIAASQRFDGTKLKKIFSVFPTLWALLYLTASFMHPHINLNDYNHVLRNVSIIALLFFFLHETRANAYGHSVPLRFTLSLMALVCTVTYEIPLLLVTAFWEGNISAMIITEFVECGAIAYIFAVLRTMIKKLEVKEEIPLPTEEPIPQES